MHLCNSEIRRQLQKECMEVRQKINEWMNKGRGVASKWVGMTKNYSTGSKKWVGRRLFSINVRQKSGWARAHLAPTPLKGINKSILSRCITFTNIWKKLFHINFLLSVVVSSFNPSGPIGERWLLDKAFHSLYFR